ncbi:hypothetical protein INR49_009632 [Caranx melampygus]|nr:hypothetical protein INR49_009632 [Caranx melampygus]
MSTPEVNPAITMPEKPGCPSTPVSDDSVTKLCPCPHRQPATSPYPLQRPRLAPGWPPVPQPKAVFEFFSMAPPRKNALPKELPEGFILKDTEKRRWRLGRKIGEGGFGLIYLGTVISTLASNDVDRPVAEDADFVIKLEYQENGPLFSELKFYQRAAKPENRQKWMKSRKLDFLGIPTYWGSGLAECNGLSYRFMVMDRLGSDLQKVWKKGHPTKTTVLRLGQELVDVLEYIHENEYVHADIKAANLMQGYRDPEKIYLVDYGLSNRYCPQGVHKEYKENPKKGHNGTIEYTSLDAHKGLAQLVSLIVGAQLELKLSIVWIFCAARVKTYVEHPSPSRRSDLQILGFCLLHWLCRSLPWDDVLRNPAQVQEAKTRLMENLPDSVQQLSVSTASTDEVAAFLLYVKTLGYQDKPDYQHLKQLLTSRDRGGRDTSVPRGSAAESPPRAADPHNREKQKAARARGASKAKPTATVVDEDIQEREKSKPVPVQYSRAPPLSKPQSQTETTLPALRRSLRPKAVRTYRDEDEYEDEDEDEDDKEETRPKPIPACYLRGPPIGPRPQSKQKTQSKQTSRKRDNAIQTPGRQTRGVHTHRREHTFLGYDSQSQTHTDRREKRREERPLHNHRAGYSHQQWWEADLCCELRDSSGDWSAVKGPGQEASPTQRTGQLHWLVSVGVLLLLGACLLGVFEFDKVHINPFALEK